MLKNKFSGDGELIPEVVVKSLEATIARMFELELLVEEHREIKAYPRKELLLKCPVEVGPYLCTKEIVYGPRSRSFSTLKIVRIR